MGNPIIGILLFVLFFVCIFALYGIIRCIQVFIVDDRMRRKRRARAEALARRAAQQLKR